MPTTSGTDTLELRRARRVEQHQRADDERGNTRRGERAVRGRFDIEDEQHERGDQEDDPEPVDGQNAQAIRREGETDHADEARHPSARAGDFDQHGLHADGDQQEDNVRVGEQEQELLDESSSRAVRFCALAVSSVRGPSLICTVKPSSDSSRSSTLSTTKSIRSASRASSGGGGFGFIDHGFGKCERLFAARLHERADGGFR